MKKSTKVLLYFGLDCGMLEFFTHTSRNLKNIDFSPAFFGAKFGGKDSGLHMETVIQTSRRLDSFLHEAAQNFQLLSNIQDQK